MMHQAAMREKVIPIANIDDERQITAVLAASLIGKHIPPHCSFTNAKQSDAMHKCLPQKDGMHVYGTVKITGQMKTL